jgi:hypothetical protein
MNTNNVKICLFVDERGGTESEGNITAHRGYQIMSDWLGVNVAAGTVLKEIRPFQLGYRSFNIYMVDIGGYPLHVQETFMRAMGNVVRSRPSRLYLFWTGETWEAFCMINPDLMDGYNCINCCEPGALEEISQILFDMEE